MSRENMQVVQRVIEHFQATGEPDWATLDEKIEVFDHDTPDQGEYRGHEAFGRWLEEWGAAWAEWSIEPEEFIDAGDRIVAVIRMKGRGTEQRHRDRPPRRDGHHDGRRKMATCRLLQQQKASPRIRRPGQLGQTAPSAADH